MRILSAVQSINGGLMFQVNCDCGAYVMVSDKQKTFECLACRRGGDMVALRDRFTREKLGVRSTTTG